MYENKARASLKRQAQRVEPYTALMSNCRASNSNLSFALENSTNDYINRKFNIFSNKILSNDKNESKENSPPNCLSPTSSIRSSSSESSQECFNLRSISNNKSSQNELELTSVMTRSASRKCAMVGAFHNKVNLEEELCVKKRWNANISYPIPSDHYIYGPDSYLKYTVSKSLNEVMSFCKCVTKLSSTREMLQVESNELPEVIDLSPYLIQEPVIINGSEETQITLHLKDDIISQQLLDIFSCDGDQNSTLFIHEENLDTITLHSGETSLFENNYSHATLSTKGAQCNTAVNRMRGVWNDHTYAQALKPASIPSPPHHEEEHFDKTLRELLLNTVLLKCLICGDTPQEMISLLERAKD